MKHAFLYAYKPTVKKKKNEKQEINLDSLQKKKNNSRSWGQRKELNRDQWLIATVQD